MEPASPLRRVDDVDKSLEELAEAKAQFPPAVILCELCVLFANTTPEKQYEVWAYSALRGYWRRCWFAGCEERG